MKRKRMYPRFNFRFMHGIEPQFLALQKGFNELIPQQLLKSFDERELELVIGGLGKIDLEDWKGNTRLKNCQPETKQVCGAYTKKKYNFTSIKSSTKKMEICMERIYV